MLVGSAQLIPCEIPTCDGGSAEPPDCPFTSAVVDSTLTTTMSANLTKEDCNKYEITGANCTEGVTVSPCSADIGGAKIDVNAVSTTSVTYAPASPTLSTGSSGAFYRDNVKLAENINFVAKSYVFTGTGSVVFTSENQGIQTINWDNCGCCDCLPDSTTQLKYEAGAPTTNSLNGSSFTLIYVGVAENNVAGITLVQTASGVAQGPWRIEVSSSGIKMDSATGLSFVYGGSLTSAVSAIDAHGYFNATIGSKITLVGGTSNALVSDLKPFLLPQNTKSTSCVTVLPILWAGDQLAPSSTGSGIYDIRGSSVFVRDSGYPDTKGGLDSFLTSSFSNPTNDAVSYGYPALGWLWYPGPGLYYLPSDFFNTGSGTSTATLRLEATFTTSDTTDSYTVTCPPPDDPNCDDYSGLCLGWGPGCVSCDNELICGSTEGTPGQALPCCSCLTQTIIVDQEPVFLDFTQSVSGSFSLL